MSNSPRVTHWMSLRSVWRVDAALLGYAHVFRVLPFMEKDVTLGPIDVSLLGTEGIVLQANRIAYLVEEPSGLRSRVHFVGGIRTKGQRDDRTS